MIRIRRHKDFSALINYIYMDQIVYFCLQMPVTCKNLCLLLTAPHLPATTSVSNPYLLSSLMSPPDPLTIDEHSFAFIGFASFATSPSLLLRLCQVGYKGLSLLSLRFSVFCNHSIESLISDEGPELWCFCNHHSIEWPSSKSNFTKLTNQILKKVPVLIYCGFRATLSSDVGFQPIVYEALLAKTNLFLLITIHISMIAFTVLILVYMFCLFCRDARWSSECGSFIERIIIGEYFCHNFQPLTPLKLLLSLDKRK